MYLNIFIILCLSFLVIAYFDNKKATKNKFLTELHEHYYQKYKKQLASNEYWYERVYKLSTLTSDQINLLLLRKLIDADEKKYEQLTQSKKNQNDLLEKWIEESSNKGVEIAREIRHIHRKIGTKLEELVNLQQNSMSKFIEKRSDSDIKLSLEKALSGFIGLEAFYRKIHELDCLNPSKPKPQEFFEEADQLADLLDQHMCSIRDRYYQLI